MIPADDPFTPMNLYISTTDVVALLLIGFTLVWIGILLDELWRWYTHRRH